jgi:Protein of unknown function (DUF3108)
MTVFVSASQRLFRPLLLLLALACAPVFAAEADLHNFVATYSVRTGGLKVGKMQRRLTITSGNHYRFESKIESTGLLALVHSGYIEESSEGELAPATLRPHRYAYGRISGDKRKETSAIFNWAESHVTMRTKDQQWKVMMDPGTLDKLVYQLALMRDLARGGSGALHYAIADEGEIKTYELSRAGAETVELSNTTVSAQKIVYARQGSSRKTTLWCAAAYGYLPIKIEYLERDGGLTTATLTALQ